MQTSCPHLPYLFGYGLHAGRCSGSKGTRYQSFQSILGCSLRSFTVADCIGLRRRLTEKHYQNPPSPSNIFGMEWIELQWHETGDLGPDSPDYIAWHDGKRVARVYSDSTILTGTHWRYFLGWYAKPNAGIADSRREAFVEVERLYNLHVKAKK